MARQAGSLHSVFPAEIWGHPRSSFLGLLPASGLGGAAHKCLHKFYNGYPERSPVPKTSLLMKLTQSQTTQAELSQAPGPALGTRRALETRFTTRRLHGVLDKHPHLRHLPAVRWLRERRVTPQQCSTCAAALKTLSTPVLSLEARQKETARWRVRCTAASPRGSATSAPLSLPSRHARVREAAFRVPSGVD